MQTVDSTTGAFNVTAHPTEEWTGQQLREAFPFDQLPRYLLRDRDAIFGNAFTEQVREMDIKEELSTPRSPWQRAYVERVIGSFVVHNKRTILWRSPLCGAEARSAHQALIRELTGKVFWRNFAQKEGHHEPGRHEETADKRPTRPRTPDPLTRVRTV
jgi:hypothetical protein